MLKLPAAVILVFLCINCIAQNAPSINVNKFYKPKENPIVKADSSYTFIDPIKKEKVKWH